MRLAALLILAGASGCTGWPAPGEQRAHDNLERVGSAYRPGDAAPEQPPLAAGAKLEDYLRFAMLESPQVEAAYYTWASDVQRITVARSLPDPRLTFEADITSMIETLMPGLMVDLPGPGKLAAAGAAAVQLSEATYFRFEQAILRTAVAVKTAYYRLAFLEDSLRVQRETLALLEDLEQLAQQQNAAGRVAFQDVLRAQIEKEQVATRIENLEDSRMPLLAELKAALGLGAGDSDPPVPSTFEPSPRAESPEALLQATFARNPVLRQMEAEVRSAESMLDLADKSGVPDFTLGLEADVDASPVMWRPKASATLPIWRDKIAAEIAGAQAERQAALARLSAEQIAVATELAAMLFTYRESERDIALLAERLIEKGRQSLSAARTAYATGRAGFIDVLDAQRQLLLFETSLIDARTRRELALTSISSAIAAVPPPGSPALPADGAGGEPSEQEPRR